MGTSRLRLVDSTTPARKPATVLNQLDEDLLQPAWVATIPELGDTRALQDVGPS